MSLINWQGWIGLSGGLILSVFVGIEAYNSHHWHKQSDRYEQLYEKDHLAFGETVVGYRQTAVQAAQNDAANKARVEAEQSAINQKKDAEYEARIADARAVAQRLRDDLASATNSSGGPGTPVPGLPAPASGADGSSKQDGLSIDDRLTATEQAIRLDELQKWVVGQHSVNVNGDPHPSH